LSARHHHLPPLSSTINPSVNLPPHHQISSSSSPSSSAFKISQDGKTRHVRFPMPPPVGPAMKPRTIETTHAHAQPYQTPPHAHTPIATMITATTATTRRSNEHRRPRPFFSDIPTRDPRPESEPTTNDDGFHGGGPTGMDGRAGWPLRIIHLCVGCGADGWISQGSRR